MAGEILCSLMYLLTAVAQPLQTILALTRSLGPRLSSMRSSNVAPSSIIQKALNMLGLSRKGSMKSKAAELDFRGWKWVSTERSLSQLSCCYAAAAVALPPLLKCWRQISPPLPLIYTMCFKPWQFPFKGCRSRKVALSNKNSDKQWQNSDKIST